MTLQQQYQENLSHGRYSGLRVSAPFSMHKEQGTSWNYVAELWAALAPLERGVDYWVESPNGQSEYHPMTEKAWQVFENFLAEGWEVKGNTIRKPTPKERRADNLAAAVAGYGWRGGAYQTNSYTGEVKRR